MVIRMKKLLVILSLFSSLSIAEEISLHNEQIVTFTSFVASQIGKPVIVESDLTSELISVDGTYQDDEQLLALLKAVIDTNGYHMAFADGFYRVTTKGPQQQKKKKEEGPDDVFVTYNFSNVRPEFFIDQAGSLPAANKVTVTAIPNSSSIAITGKKLDVDRLIQFAQAFDVKPRQVLIESVIMETNNTNSESVGFFLRSSLSDSGFSASANTTFNPVDFSGVGGVLSYLSGGDLRLFVNLVKTHDDITILSEPELLTLDRQEANITVGQNVPFLVSSEATDGGNLIQKIERQDVGLQVRVKPELIGDDIRLTIFQEISNVTNSTIASDIITNKRSISTTARLLSGNSIVIGGLISEDVQNLENKVPVLGSLPGIGRAFRSNNDSVVSRELKLIIKATII